MKQFTQQLSKFDPITGVVEGAPPAIERRLSDLKGVFADELAYEAALAEEDSLVYSTYCVAPEQGDGAMLYCIGKFMPGRIGAEYYMTKGHIHARPETAEFYFGLRGQGVMLLEDEASGDSQLLPLLPNGAIYVPRHTAHRTMNTGEVPLTYLSVVLADAGHDYEVIAARGNFRKVVVDLDGQPTMLDRAGFLESLSR